MLRNSQETVTALYEAFARRDLPTVQSLTDSEVVVSQTPLLPWGGVFTGHGGLREFFERLLRYVDSRVVIDEMIVAGDDLVALGHTRGQVRSTGAPFDIRVAHVWTVRGERIVRFQPFIDTPAMLQALGRAS